MRLHLGCGEIYFPGWVNLDLSRGHDLRLGLGDWEANSISEAYSSHLLEHLTFQEGAALLREVYRVLRVGGAARLGVPDFRLFAEAYVAGDRAFSEAYFAHYCPEVKAPWLAAQPGGNPIAYRDFGSAGALLAIVFGWGHKAIYDADILATALRAAGFAADQIEVTKFGESRRFNAAALDRNFADHTVFVEAVKSLPPSRE
ncbi:MAG: hypothetical protein HYV63_13410 [Candidatus Schekmanbacteria bacterium]|nr:hypothetical protein [Candidatus Schekmanbacteria bacterium]